MRGTVLNVSVPVAVLGITPAHAGNRPPSRLYTCHSWDHPRTCGEQTHLAPTSQTTTGSPPHMRGTVVRRGRLYIELWITPAHAGNRVRLLWLVLPRRDHPRTCGEQLPLMQCSVPFCGSPPHMRGTDVGKENRHC